jgi:GTPase
LKLVANLDGPVFLVLNKIDMVEKQKLLPLIAGWNERYKFAQVLPISARRKDGLQQLEDALVAVLPAGERYFPEHQVTDQPERFLVAELIREKILLATGQEVPYASAVIVERFQEPNAAEIKAAAKSGKLPLTRISAAILCERDSQKAILIGKRGAMLKQIGTDARKDIEAMLGTRVMLELFVKVEKDWRDSAKFIEELDWRRQLDGLTTPDKERH